MRAARSLSIALALEGFTSLTAPAQEEILTGTANKSKEIFANIKKETEASVAQSKINLYFGEPCCPSHTGQRVHARMQASVVCRLLRCKWRRRMRRVHTRQMLRPTLSRQR